MDWLQSLEGTIFFIRYIFCFLDRNNMFGDDSRLSHLVKRITKDSERDRRLTAVQQLEEFLNNADNHQVVNNIVIIKPNIRYELYFVYVALYYITFTSSSLV